MGRGKTCLIRGWGLVLLTLLYLTPQTLSSNKGESRTCAPSHCGNITNISYPFRLRGDPLHCGLLPFELSCENDVTLLHLHPETSNSTYHVLGINYNNFTIRLRDPGIRERNCSSLPRHLLSRSNFSDAYDGSFDYHSSNPYIASVGQRSHSELAFEHVIYLNCSNPVRDDARYADTADCVDWGSKGGYVYAVPAGDIEAGLMKPECGVKSVATIVSDWGSFLREKTYSYNDIHRLLSHGFELSWWPQACSDLQCAPDESCFFNRRKQNIFCSKMEAFCYGSKGVPFSLFCGKGANQTSPPVQAFLVGILAGLPSSNSMHQFAEEVYSEIYSKSGDKYDGDFISIPVAFTLGKITAYSVPIILRFLVGMILLFILLIYKYRRRHLSMYESIEDFIRLYDLHPIRYSYNDLKTMTNGFETKIGEGGFGTVYKGKLRSGSHVAIKMLGKKSKATGQEFINEVATMGRIHHFNVVHLVGFCVEGMNRALIYEFMSNGSLDKHIFSKEGHVSLSYREIHDISIGVARGIAYLHHGCDMQILHFDIKPHNILLDEKFTPKISDFGLAKLHVYDNSIATMTAAKGTIGYMAPELFYKSIGKVSHKADVYSFGMLLMEMASRRRNLNPRAEHSSQVYFPTWIYDQFGEEKDLEMDDLIGEEKTLAKKMLMVALWCIQLNPANRPSMNKVIEMLEVDDVASLEMPPKPSLYPQDDQPSFDQTTSSFSISSHCSLGEDTSEKE